MNSVCPTCQQQDRADLILDQLTHWRVWSWEHPHCMYVSLLQTSAGTDKPAATEAKSAFFYGHLASSFRENSGVLPRLGLLSPIQSSSIVPPGIVCLHLLPEVLFWFFLWPRLLIIWCEPWSNPWALCPATTGVSRTFQIYGNWF